MNFIKIIEKKKHAQKLTRSELEYFINGVTDESIPDYQISAFLMAMCFNPPDFEETYDLTDLMAHSGNTIDLSSINGIKADKHSTGGVGDKTTL
ncbi:MAG: pyrimidine-nucleoside phosphorylase, partial [Clostridia bacterium]